MQMIYWTSSSLIQFRLGCYQVDHSIASLLLSFFSYRVTKKKQTKKPQKPCIKRQDDVELCYSKS